jgi:hypothetical protein
MTPQEQQQQRTAENELRNMIGDLFMQFALVRAELVNLKAAQPQKANGLDREAPDADHRPEPS